MLSGGVDDYADPDDVADDAGAGDVDVVGDVRYVLVEESAREG